MEYKLYLHQIAQVRLRLKYKIKYIKMKSFNVIIFLKDKSIFIKKSIVFKNKCLILKIMICCQSIYKKIMNILDNKIKKLSVILLILNNKMR